MSNLGELLLSAYHGHDESLMLLIEKFRPLLTKYAYKLSYDDSYLDLQLSFIELIKRNNPESIISHNEGSLVNYVRQSIYHSYLSLSKAKEHSKLFLISLQNTDGDSDEYFNKWDKMCSETDSYEYIEFDFLRSVLTQRETEIIIQHFWMGATITEIAKNFHVSPPAITQSKNNAIKKLKSVL